MTGPTCADVQDVAAEFALDILPGAERSAVAAHLLRCPTCRQEVESLAEVGDRLLELVPGTEPPLGFDRRVLARVRDLDPAADPTWPAGNRGGGRLRAVARRRPRFLVTMVAAAAVVALVFGGMGWLAGRSNNHPHNRVIFTAELRQGNRDVGEVYAYPGSPGWLSMTVNGVTGSQKVTCELVDSAGQRISLGSFDLVGGSGSWGAPDHGGFAHIAKAQLVSSNGTVIATATVPGTDKD
jgi:hypothetical protein